MNEGEVHWDKDGVIDQLRQLGREAIARIAFFVEAEAKVNITQNDQIDTGFMLNSVYATTQEESGHAQARTDAKKQNPEGIMADEPPIGDADALVAVGASYAIYQEAAIPFLFPAVQRGIDQAKRLIEEAGSSPGGL